MPKPKPLFAIRKALAGFFRNFEPTALGFRAILTE